MVHHITTIATDMLYVASISRCVIPAASLEQNLAVEALEEITKASDICKSCTLVIAAYIILAWRDTKEQNSVKVETTSSRIVRI